MSSDASGVTLHLIVSEVIKNAVFWVFLPGLCNYETFHLAYNSV